MMTKEKILNLRYSAEQMRIYVLFAIVCLLCGCHNKKEEKVESQKKDTIPTLSNLVPHKEDIPKIPIDIVLEHIKHPLDGESDYCYQFKIVNQNESEIWIEPTSTYYDSYMSGKRMEIITGATPEFDWTNEYPILGCYLINNTENALNINRLDIKVESSDEDPLPFLYIFCNEEHSNSITFVNGNWTNWEQAKLDYKILKKGETFDGKYDRNKTIPYFEDSYSLNFVDDLIDMGYDFEKVCKAAKITMKEGREQGVGLFGFDDEHFDDYKDLFYPFEIGFINETEYVADSDTESDAEEDFGPKRHEYGGFARIYGRLSFASHPHQVEFQGKLSLSSALGLGAALDEDERFDVELRPKGSDYVLHYPYTTKISSGGSERVSIRLKCKRSAIHTLVIDAVNNNGLKICSKKIHLHYLFPRFGTKIIWSDN